MPTFDEKFLLYLLRACAGSAPEPLYPVHFARERNLDRDKLDAGLDELRRRGLMQFTEWVKDNGQGYALTEAGRQALAMERVPAGRSSAVQTRQHDSTAPGWYGKGETVRRAIFAPQPARIVWLLLTANLLYFGYGAIYVGQHNLEVADYLTGKGPATTKALIDLGALPLIFHDEFGRPREQPQFHRIILAMFLHIGLVHLGMNMYFLFALGQQIEGMWGSWRFLTIYFSAGIVSGCLVVIIGQLQGRPALTAGASGAMFGIFMAMVVFFWLNREHLPQQLIQDWSRNLAINAFLLLAINFMGGVSWQGHLGGAIGGLLTALLLHVQRFHPAPAIRLLALGAVPMVPLAFLLAVLLQHAGMF